MINTLFVNLKSELTFAKETLELFDYKVYRTRTECNCIPGQNRRDAIIAILSNNNGIIINEIIRCRRCAKEVVDE